MAKRILAVDDESSLRELYERVLEEQGYSVTAVGGLAEAKALLESGSFDLLITDLLLADGAGTELMDLAAEKNAGSKTILVTGTVEPDELQLFAERYSLDGVFGKPFRLASLVTKVNELLGR